MITGHDIQKRRGAHHFGACAVAGVDSARRFDPSNLASPACPRRHARSRRPAAGNNQIRAQQRETRAPAFPACRTEDSAARDHRRATDHCHKCHGKAAAIAAEQFPEHAAEHHSPRRIGAGSKCAARRKGIRPPASATSAASPRTIGRRTIRGDAGAPKTLSPRKRARPCQRQTRSLRR